MFFTLRPFPYDVLYLFDYGQNKAEKTEKPKSVTEQILEKLSGIESRLGKLEDARAA